MPIKSRTIGTGITQEKITEFVEPLTPEEKSEWLRLSRELSREETHEGLYLKPLEVWARKVLEEAGLATSQDSLTSLMKLPIKDREWTTDNKGPTTERDSREGYAIRSLTRVIGIRYLLKRNRRGDAEEATRLGIELGMLIEECRMKFSWEKDALSALHHRLDFEAGRDAYNKQRKIDAEEEYRWFQILADPIWENNPHWSRTMVASMIKHLEPDLPSVETIRKHIKKQN